MLVFSIGLGTLDADSFPAAYFAPREEADAWTWAARNLEGSGIDLQSGLATAALAAFGLSRR